MKLWKDYNKSWCISTIFLMVRRTELETCSGLLFGKFLTRLSLRIYLAREKKPKGGGGRGENTCPFHLFKWPPMALISTGIGNVWLYSPKKNLKKKKIRPVWLKFSPTLSCNYVRLVQDWECEMKKQYPTISLLFRCLSVCCWDQTIVTIYIYIYIWCKFMYSSFR